MEDLQCARLIGPALLRRTSGADYSIGAVGGAKRGTIMKATLAAVAVFIFGVGDAFGEMATFKDIQKPGGHERGRAERRAAFRDCGAGPNYEIPVAQFQAFRRCMQERGWGLDHMTRTEAEAARDRAADEKARPWCYGAACAPDDSECMDDPSNTFSICGDSP